MKTDNLEEELSRCRPFLPGERQQLWASLQETWNDLAHLVNHHNIRVLSVSVGRGGRFRKSWRKVLDVLADKERRLLYAIHSGY